MHSENGKLKLLKTCFISTKLLGNKDPSFCVVVIAKYSNKPLRVGGLPARPPNGGSAWRLVPIASEDSSLSWRPTHSTPDDS